ncbi:SRPBCC family protein [Leptolyngbya sp. FACHB-541]|uniref:SRPBCC family protein n=1 Tax=Leptolyngbya sp. FACHB-541 TaxID=2692810 RepID=UPI001686EF09|nr:SRPBCC family protein [Leptolyngbya sp. FACHB-541]MBD1995838.1 SRPBCC family protein [Leptolyngbya sp. FACHB-541]
MEAANPQFFSPKFPVYPEADRLELPVTDVYNLNSERSPLAAQDAAAPELVNVDLPYEPALLEDVEVETERLDGRQRRISAKVQIPYPAEQVWQILTDYEKLSDFIPSLSKSRQIPHPQGGIRLEQVGTQCLLNFKFCARVVLDMVENFPQRLDFKMIEGDFKVFSGSWQLQPITLGNQTGTELCYSVLVLPRMAMPVGLIERRLSTNLAMNLVAIRERANELFSLS